MFDKLVKNEIREGTLVFIKNKKIILIIDNTYNNTNFFTGKEAKNLLLRYFGLDLDDLFDSELIEEDNNIKAYFLEA